MDSDFEIIEHTADIGIRACGDDPAQAYSNAARGMFSLITNLDGIRETRTRDVEVSAADSKTLLVEWLNELIYLFDVDQMVFGRFEITTLTDTGITAKCYGEKIDHTRHEIKRGIKSATYHMLKIEKNEGYRVEVLFDI